MSKRLRGGTFKWFILSGILTFGIVFGLLYISNSAEHRLNNYIEELSSLAGEAESTSSSLKIIAEPNASLLRKKGEVRDYAQSIENVASNLDIYVPKSPKKPVRFLSNEQVNKYFETLESQSHANTLKFASTYEADLQTLLSHFPASMRVVANILEYDVELDMSVTDKQQLTERLAAAGEGLAITSEKLSSLSGYKDPTKDKLVESVKKVDETRKAYQFAIIEDRASELERSAYVNVALQAQEEILKNRAEFWAANINTELKNLDWLAKNLKLLSSQLYASLRT